jgi:hypothetical protein
MSDRCHPLCRITAMGLILASLSGCMEACLEAYVDGRDRADKFRFVGTNQPDRIAKQVDIQETVFRYQMERLTPGELSGIAVCFLGVNHADPSNEILLRLGGARLPVFAYSMATCDEKGCYFDKDGRRGIGLDVGEMRWMGNDKVQVKGSFHGASLWGADYKYTLIFSNRKWHVVCRSRQWIS